MYDDEHFVSLPLAIPIFVFPAGQASESETKIIKHLGSTEFNIEIPANSDFHQNCVKKNIIAPYHIRAKYVPFRHITEFLVYYKVFKNEFDVFLENLKKEQNEISKILPLIFHLYYNIIVLIDCEENKDPEIIREQVMNVIQTRTRLSFFYFNYPANATDNPPSNATILLKEYSDQTCIHSIAQALQDPVIISIYDTEIFQIYSSKAKYNKDSQNYKYIVNVLVRNSLRLISDEKEIVGQAFEEIFKLTDLSKEANGLVCEIRGLIEERFFGLTTSFSKPPNDYSLWALAENDITPFFYFSNACFFYNTGKYYTKSVDCGLRVLKMGNSDVINSLCTLICKETSKKGMFLRGKQLISLCLYLNHKRTAALVAYRLGTNFQEKKKAEFFVLCLNILLDLQKEKQEKKEQIKTITRSPSAQARFEANEKNDIGLNLSNLFSHIVSQLFVYINDVPKLTKLLLTILSVVGTELPSETLHMMFAFLKAITISDLQFAVHLKISVLKCEPIKPNISIQERSAGKSVFIYNGVSGKNSKLVTSVGSPLLINVRLNNPYSEAVPIISRFDVSSNQHLRVDDIAVDLTPRNSTDLQMMVTPTASGSYSISRISFTVFDCLQYIDLLKPIEFTAVKNAPSFSVRTDLLNRTLSAFEGEWINFKVWILNTSPETAISNITLNFKDAFAHAVVSKPILPLEPLSESSVSVKFKATLRTKSISFSVICDSYFNDSSENQSNESKEGQENSSNSKDNQENNVMKATYDFSREIEVSPGLSIQSIFPLSTRPETFNDNKSLIYFGIDLFNFSPVTITFTASFHPNNKKEQIPFTGFLNSNPLKLAVANNGSSILLVAADRDCIKQFISTFNDTVRTNLIKNEIEKKSNTKMSKEEYQQTEKIAAFAAYLDESLSIEWTTAGGRNGSVDKTLLIPDSQILDIILKRSIISADIVYKEKDKVVKNPTQFKDTNILITFSSPVKSCKLIFDELDLTNDLNACNDIAWQGTLEYKYENTEYSFILCFLEAKKYNLYLVYTEENNHTASIPIQIDVNK